MTENKCPDYLQSLGLSSYYAELKCINADVGRVAGKSTHSNIEVKTGHIYGVSLSDDIDSLNVEFSALVEHQESMCLLAGQHIHAPWQLEHTFVINTPEVFLSSLSELSKTFGIVFVGPVRDLPRIPQSEYGVYDFVEKLSELVPSLPCAVILIHVGDSEDKAALKLLNIYSSRLK